MNNLLTTVGTAVAGVVLAVATSFGIVTAANSSPEPVDEPAVVYGER